MSYHQGLGGIYRWSKLSTGYVCVDNTGKRVNDLWCQNLPKEEKSDGGFDLKAGGKAVLDLFTSEARAKGKAAAYDTRSGGGTPSWLLPVGIGAAVLGVVLIATKKKD